MFHRMPQQQDNAQARKEEVKAPSAAPRQESNVAEKVREDIVVPNAPQKQMPQATQQPQQQINSKQKEAQPMSNETNETQGQRPVDIPGSSPYQRPMGGPAQYGYAGMQSGSSMQSQSSGRRLMIGEGITLSGEIESCDHLIVEGTVEAALKGAKILDIAENGVYYGTVEIENATIAGRFEGDIRVDGRLTVKSTGVIIGTITYRELAVESGATIDGKIAPLTGTQSTAKDSNKAASGAADFSKSRAATKAEKEEEVQMNFSAAEKATANA
jgi:cytoskeletal protein CcmA (bactofilin family)